ncbi:MAG: YraN family protein [Bacteroidota bacterium]|nr:YraN family protein [Bacteroidota bacterium]
MAAHPQACRLTGNAGEAAAANFLRRLGYEILERQYRFNHGEIDLVARDGSELVFVEVKTRRTEHFGRAEETVTPKKQELLRRTAEGYVDDKKFEDVSCRFDVIAVQVRNGKAEITHFKNAF